MANNLKDRPKTGSPPPAFPAWTRCSWAALAQTVFTWWRARRAPVKLPLRCNSYWRASGGGETGLYVTLSESEEELRAVADSHGWSLEGLSLFELVPEGGIDPEQEQSVLHPSEIELGETTRRILAELERAQPRRIVFDSLSELRLLAQDALRYRRQINVTPVPVSNDTPPWILRGC